MHRFVRKAVWLVPAVLMLCAPQAYAQKINLVGTLDGGEEAPNKVNTGALGTAEVGVDVGNSEVSVTVRVFNIPTGTVGGHIHVGAEGTAGPIIFDLAPPNGTTGDFTLSMRLTSANLIPRAAQGILTMDDAIQALTAGNTYLNIHTSTNPGGEIRAQLLVK